MLCMPLLRRWLSKPPRHITAITVGLMAITVGLMPGGTVVTGVSITNGGTATTKVTGTIAAGDPDFRGLLFRKTGTAADGSAVEANG